MQSQFSDIGSTKTKGISTFHIPAKLLVSVTSGFATPPRSRLERSGALDSTRHYRRSHLIPLVFIRHVKGNEIMEFSSGKERVKTCLSPFSLKASRDRDVDVRWFGCLVKEQDSFRWDETTFLLDRGKSLSFISWPRLLSLLLCPTSMVFELQARAGE